MRKTSVLCALGLAIGAAALAGCSGGSETTCGAGTRLVDGECVAEGEVACGAGTVLVGGECVPEGEVSCGAGTVLVDGDCVAEIGACGEGTVLHEGACVPWIEVVEADLDEAPEDNDGRGLGTPGSLTLPAVGEDALVLGGTIDTPVDLDGYPGVEPDVDTWLFTAEAGTRVAVEGWSDGLFNVAFAIMGADLGTNDFFVRSEIDTASSEAQREVVIPADGQYLLAVSDAANFDAYRTSWAVGGPDLRYFAAVSTVTSEDPTAVTLGSTVEGQVADVDRHALDAPAGALVEVVVDAFTPDRHGVVLVQGADTGLVGEWAATDDGVGLSWSPISFVMPEGGALITVDSLWTANYGRGDGGYRLTVRANPNVVDATPGETQSLDLGDSLGYRLLRFEVEDVAIVTVAAAASGSDLEAGLGGVDAQLEPLARSEASCWSGPAQVPCFFEHDFSVPPEPIGLLLQQPGVFYVRVWDLAVEAGSSYTVDVDLGLTQVQDLGSLGAGATLDATGLGPVTDPEGGAYFLLDVATAGLVTATFQPSAWDLAVELTSIGKGLPLAEADEAGGGLAEQVRSGLSGPVLIRVSGEGSGGTFDLEATHAPIPGEHEPNDSPAAAETATFDVGGEAWMVAHVTDPADLDYVAITIPEERSLLVAETLPAGDDNAETYLWLYGDDGATVLAENEDIDSSGGNFFSRVIAPVTAGETYYVAVGCTVWSFYCVPDVDYLLHLSAE